MTDISRALSCAYAAMPHLKRRGAGKSITVGSGIGPRGRPGSSAYACSKAGLWMLTRVLTQELWPSNISVNALIPGPVRTAMSAQEAARSARVLTVESEWLPSPRGRRTAGAVSGHAARYRPCSAELQPYASGYVTMARRMSSHSQLDLFAAPAMSASPSEVGTAAVAPELAALAASLPVHLYLGTSSWAFPGWQGLVYDRAAAPSVLARHGLAAYAQHPLLRTVGLDRTFYAPLPAAELAAYAAAVPDDFRFLVKAHAWCTQPVLRAARHAGPRGQAPNAHFLDPDYASEQVVQPCLTGLRDKTGPLLWQFSPLDVQAVGGPQRFAARLHAFLAALPRGPQYAVELRNASLLTPAYREALLDLGVCHCCNIHPSMPALQEQMYVVPLEAMPALIIRWMLHPAQRYAEAAPRYQPFDRIVDDDPSNRQRITTMCRTALAAGRSTFVIANNKAEGSAPCTIARLAVCLAQAT